MIKDRAIDSCNGRGVFRPFNDFIGKPLTYSGVSVDGGNMIRLSIVGGDSGDTGAWDGAVPTQRYGYVFSRKTDCCGPFGARRVTNGAST